MVQNPWVSLQDPGLLRGSLFQDRYGVFGGDLIVVTTTGGVWRVDSAGAATRLANLDVHLEGVTTVPDDPGRYGPWAAKIVVGAEQQGNIHTVDDQGNVATFSLDISPEGIEIIPSDENFVGVDFGGKQLQGAPASEFAGMVGDFLIAQEGGALWHVRWDPATGSFQTEQVARVEQWEHVTFAPVGFPVFEYAVKFICGRTDGEILAPGVYYTAINVHNPTNTAVGLSKKVRGRPSLRAFRPTDAVLRCQARPRRSPGDRLPGHRPPPAGGRHGRPVLQGLAKIQSKVELDVVAVYTAAGADRGVETLHTERVPARQVGLEPPTEEPPPAEPAQLA